LLKLCAQAAADAQTETDDTTSSSPSKLTKLLSFGCESVIRVGRNVAFDQAIDILVRAGRTPDCNYARELLKVGDNDKKLKTKLLFFC